jgi:hypothetical protein
MKRQVVRTVAAASAALGFVGFAAAANASAAPAHGPSWHSIHRLAKNGEFEAVVATGKTSGFAFFEPSTTVAVPAAYERTGATTFKSVQLPTVADEWIGGAAASSPSNVYVFADILTVSTSKPKSEVLKWTGKKFEVVATFSGELGGGTVLSPNDVYAYGSGIYGSGMLPGAGVFHYNGHAWTKISSTVNGNGDALSATSAYVADGTDIDHYNGHKWTATNLASLLPGANSSKSLSGVLALSADDILVTGDGGQSGVILRYNGQQWAKVASSPTAIGPPTSDGSGGLWAPGNQPGEFDRLVHYSDGKITTVTTPVYDHSHADVDSISRIPGSTNELAGGVFPLPKGKTYSPGVVLQYS